MNRRRFIIAGGTTTLLALGGTTLLLGGSGDKTLTINDTLPDLEKLLRASPSMTGPWSLGKVLQHCAQSIEYSMQGFPEHKSDFFKHTVGSAAFTAFDSVGKMTHNLQEAIPGAPDIANDVNLKLSFERLSTALETFQSYTGQLQPHFAFGSLSKAEYERAHIMHINNHLQEVIEG